ncbi:hypothetical protein MVEN_02338600 [Mycena venus]|uniref:Pali-domain-containing protein n=1 Tax=Mycena venus TaxID=2733690 RepID=A0A8H6X448_9AGAR|nr:hypothetical protein MVEN_02338600 [Mycena venus]
MVACLKTLGLVSVGAGTALLGMVAFAVPYFKSVYFLRIDLGSGAGNGTSVSVSKNSSTTPANASSALNLAGSPDADQSWSGHAFVDLGPLGFCTNLDDGQGLHCSNATIGYSLHDAANFIDFNGTLPAPLAGAANTVATTLTKVLVVHLIAFAIAVVSFAFALLSFIGVPIAACCSSCFCGFAAATAFAVLIFDVVFFEVIKKRVEVQEVGGAKVGNAMYLTMLACLLLFVAPAIFLIERLCVCCRPFKKSR